MALTAKQRQLLKEIQEISSIIGMDHWNIEKYKHTTHRLGIIKDQLVRGEVVVSYTLMDELLSQIIVSYYFEQEARGRKRRQEQFRLFCHYILDRLTLLHKLDLVHAIGEIPKDVWNIVTGINNLRNPIAHSFFPQHRRQFAVGEKVVYRGLDIFSPAGIRAFRQDVYVARDYFLDRAGFEE
jgi:hypothetical protein